MAVTELLIVISVSAHDPVSKQSMVTLSTYSKFISLPRHEESSLQCTVKESNESFIEPIADILALPHEYNESHVISDIGVSKENDDKKHDTELLHIMAHDAVVSSHDMVVSTDCPAVSYTLC